MSDYVKIPNLEPISLIVKSIRHYGTVFLSDLNTFLNKRNTILVYNFLHFVNKEFISQLLKHFTPTPIP